MIQEKLLGERVRTSGEDETPRKSLLAKELVASYYLENEAGIVDFFSTDRTTAVREAILLRIVTYDFQYRVFAAYLDGTGQIQVAELKTPAVSQPAQRTSFSAKALDMPARQISMGEAEHIRHLVYTALQRSVLFADGDVRYPSEVSAADLNALDQKEAFL